MLALRYFQKEKKKAIKQWGTYLRSPTAFACVCHDEVTTLFSINRKHCWAFSLNEHNKRCWCHQFNTAKHSSQFRETDSSLGKAMYRLLLLMCTHRSTLGDNFGTKWWIVIFACWDNWHWPYIKAAQEWWQNLRQCEINSKFVSDWPYKRARVLFTKRTDDASQLDYWIFFSYKFSGRKAKKKHDSAKCFSINHFLLKALESGGMVITQPTWLPERPASTIRKKRKKRKKKPSRHALLLSFASFQDGNQAQTTKVPHRAVSVRR